MHITKITSAFGIFIIFSSSFARQVMDFIKANAGEKVFINLVGLCGVIVTVCFLAFFLRKSPSFFKIAVFIAILAAGMILVWQLEIPEERIHVLEFSILGWLASRDLNKTKKSFKGFVFAFAFIILVGAVDEAFQAVLPYRYFQWRDIIFNIAGGGWGIFLYLSC